MPPELGRERDDIEAVMGTQRLLVLDDVWTSYLDHASPDDVRRDLPDLKRLVKEMQKGLTEIRRRLPAAIDRLAQLSDEDIEQALTRLLDADAANATDLRASFAEDVGEEGLRRTLVAACVYVDLEAEEEIEYLGAKLDRLRKGKFEPGDMRPGTRCAVELVGVALGAVGCAAGLLGCVSAVGPIVTGLVLSWKESGCRNIAKRMFSRLKRKGIKIL